MPEPIEIVDSPRPEPGQEPPLPTYHELLNLLCSEFHIPGSPTFWEAVKYIKDNRDNRTQKFLEWYTSAHTAGDSDITNPNFTLGHHASSKEGREWIVRSYSVPIRLRLEQLRSNTRIDRARGLVLCIENLIALLPEDERFSEPVMTLRGFLSELYNILEREPSSDEPPPYDGPRPTRFDRLNEDDT